jgi:cob(I)alamin adenosyltransferase
MNSHTGDDGNTSLPDGRRISKNSQVIEVYGRIDELVAWIGLLGDLNENSVRKHFLKAIQQNLMNMLSSVSTEAGSNSVLPGDDCMIEIENQTVILEDHLKPLDGFVLPGGNIASSYCHIARCVCRNAERAFVELKLQEPVHDILGKYLNRLSDYLFALARTILYESGNQDVMSVKPTGE